MVVLVPHVHCRRCSLSFDDFSNLCMNTQEQMEPVCGKCGDRGHAKALVCCVECQDAYEHRYCFDKASDIFRWDIKWVCEDCSPSNPKKPIIKNRILPSRRSGRLGGKTPATDNAGSPAKVARSSGSTKRTLLKSEGSDTPENSGLKNTASSTKPSQRRRCAVDESEHISTEVPSESEKKTSEVSNGNPSDLRAKDCLWQKMWPAIVDSSRAFPMRKPIWKGSFRLCREGLGVVKGMAAHLSTLACPKARQEASSLPVVLHPDVVPRSIVWPKSFEKAEPEDTVIGLYFLPESGSDGKDFDSLVNEMISDDLAMIYAVKNAELLVFTSMKLPFDYWRFQGRRYLWGVFRAKQTPVSS